MIIKPFICKLSTYVISVSYTHLKDPTMKFSDKIKLQREQNQLTQKELAELVGVSQRAIAAYESSGTIARISTCLLYTSRCV